MNRSHCWLLPLVLPFKRYIVLSLIWLLYCCGYGNSWHLIWLLDWRSFFFFLKISLLMGVWCFTLQRVFNVSDSLSCLLDTTIDRFIKRVCWADLTLLIILLTAIIINLIYFPRLDLVSLYIFDRWCCSLIVVVIKFDWLPRCFSLMFVNFFQHSHLRFFLCCYYRRMFNCLHGDLWIVHEQSLLVEIHQLLVEKHEPIVLRLGRFILSF